MSYKNQETTWAGAQTHQLWETIHDDLPLVKLVNFFLKQPKAL